VVVVVTKKISKHAVVRNRIRRRLSALLAEHWATVATGYDIVVTVQSDVAEAPINDLAGHLIVAMDKAKIKTAP
jgi:ribonuclease P protein component